MTTPDTSAVRAWARENGYEVADRGRLPAEITDAYAAAHGKGGRTAKPATAKPAKAASSRATPAKATRAVKAPAAKAAAPAVPAADENPGAPVAAAAPAADPQPKPSRVADDRRLVALGEQLAALTERVAKLEKSAGSGGKDNGKPSRFRRRS